METTAKALVDHWTWAAAKGLMNKNTANGLRAACAQVLGVLDDWENVDIKALDTDATFARFQNLRKKDFKPAVLDTYKRRFRQAVASYLAYLDDPAGWKPRTIGRPTRTDGQNGSERPAEPISRGGVVPGIPQAGLVEYPFPIREGLIARLVLPRDLKTSEVKRLTAFMSTLAADYDSAVA